MERPWHLASSEPPCWSRAAEPRGKGGTRSLSQGSVLASREEGQGRWPREGSTDSPAPAIRHPLWEVAGVSLEDSCLCKTVCSSPSKVIRLVSVLLQGAHSRDSDLEPEEGWVSFKNTFRRQEGSLRASPFPSNSQHRSLPPPTTRGVQFSLQHSNSNPLKKRGQTENGCFYSAPRGSSRGTACFTLKPPPQKMR